VLKGELKDLEIGRAGLKWPPLESLNKLFKFKTETKNSIRKEESSHKHWLIPLPQSTHGWVPIGVNKQQQICIQEKQLHGKARISVFFSFAMRFCTVARTKENVVILTLMFLL
jgi:hypothetical protein